VYFTVYDKLKHKFASAANGQLSVAGNVLAAAGAGTASAIVTNPLWVVKTRFQVFLFLLLFHFLVKMEVQFFFVNSNTV
jgi:Mitochondrial carrier protein